MLLILLISCAPPLDIDKSIANGLIQSSEDLKKQATNNELEVIRIAKEDFTFEKAEEAKEKLTIAVDFYRQSLAKNEEAISLIKDEELLKLRKFMSSKTAKTIECNEYSLDLLNEVLAHGEMTLTPEINNTMAKVDVCEEERIQLISP